jgi:hypothetical protein
MAKWIDICATCGARADTNIPARPGVPAAGYCMKHREAPAAEYDAWREKHMTERRSTAKAAAMAYWASRGVKPGDQVRVYGWHLLGGRFPIVGVAKVGVGGPYVFSKAYGQLDAAGAERA